MWEEANRFEWRRVCRVECYCRGWARLAGGRGNLVGDGGLKRRMSKIVAEARA